MKSITKKVVNELEKRKIVYEILTNENKDKVEIKIVSDGASVKGIITILSFEKDTLSVVVDCGIKVPEGKKFTILQNINEFNCNNKWTKFIVSGDNKILLTRVDNLYKGDIENIVFSAMWNIYSIADRTYPELKKIAGI